MGPDSSTQPTTTPAPDATSTGGSASPSAQSWIDAAKTNTPDLEHSSAAPIPQENDKEQSPTVIQPIPHTGLRGVIDKTLDALAGTHGIKLAEDQKGGVYIQHPALSRGQQWMKIAFEGLQGAAHGLAAGKGAGNMGRAAVAGLEQGEKNQQQATDLENNYKLQVANSQALSHQLAAQQLQATREGIKFDRETSDYYQKHYNDTLAIPGAQDLGKVTNLSELAQLMKENPAAIQQQVDHGDIRIIPNFNSENGIADGFHAVLMPARWGEEQMPAGTPFNIAVPDPAKPGYFKPQEEHTAGPISRRQLSAYNDAAQAKINDAAIAQHKIEADEADKNSQKKLRDQQASAIPSEIRERDAQANLANEKAKKVKTGEITADEQANPEFNAMVDAVYNGDILPSDLKREAKGANLDPNKIMAGAVQKGLSNGKPWSASIIEQEHNFAKQPKTQAAIDGIDRIISPQSGYMAQMLDTARAAGLGPVGFANSMMLASRRAYGEKTAKNLQTLIAENRRSIAGLIGNPLLGGGETDKKLEQANELLGKSPTMENLESAASIINSALATQRSSLVGNNRFLLKRFGATAGGSQQPAAAQQQSKPAAAPAFQAFSSDGKWGWDGKQWVATGK